MFCHEKHQHADAALAIMRRPATGIAAAQRDQLRTILTTTDWHAEPCGEFGRWWFSTLLGQMDWAASSPDKTILDALVCTWFELSVHMLHEPETYCPLYPSLRALQETRTLPNEFQGIDAFNLQRHCRRFERIELNDWAKTFEEGLRRSPRIAESLTAHFGTFVSRFRTDLVVLQCLSSIADRVALNPALRMKFLGAAEKFAVGFPRVAHELLEPVLKVAETQPVDLLPFAGEYLLRVPHSDVASPRLLQAHDTIHAWVEGERARGDHAAVATMRRAQEKFVPHLQNRRIRHTHRMGHARLEATIVPRDGAARIQGVIADISLGRDTAGRGVRISAPNWQLKSGTHRDKRSWGDSQLYRNTIEASARSTTLKIEFEDPDVELRWGDRRVRSSSYSIRAVSHTNARGAETAFCVLFLTSSDPEFAEWQEYVRQLPPVDYGDSDAHT